MKKRLKGKVIFVICLATAAFILYFWGVNLELLIGGHSIAPEMTTYENSAVCMALGDSLIFRDKHYNVGAIRFDKMTDDWGADYTSWFFSSEEKEKRFNPQDEHNGHVFERYWRTREGLNSYNVKDIGGMYKIKCGNLELSWSSPTWVYIPEGYLTAVIQGTSIYEVDVYDESIQWKKIVK